MVKPELYDEIISQLPNMGAKQLRELIVLAQGAQDSRQERFRDLVNTLEETLRTIAAEFSQAHIPLIVYGPDEVIDIMDYIIPNDFAKRCKMGDE